MKAVSTSEMSVNFYETTRRNNPEDSLHTHHSDNLKSHLLKRLEELRPAKLYRKTRKRVSDETEARPIACERLSTCEKKLTPWSRFFFEKLTVR
jgi:hypothetical protein